MVHVLSLGGSIVAPQEPDTAFLVSFSAMARLWLSQDCERRLILVVGGGAPARIYQKTYSDVCSLTLAGSGIDTEKKSDCLTSDVKSQFSNTEADWLGIMATRLNAQLLKAIFSDICLNDVVYDPTAPFEFEGRVLIAAGWKPGFSTDTDAVYLAERFNAKTIINLSNIAKVYTDDPKKNPNAESIDCISWDEFRKMVGDEWTPGKNTPFDPIASQKAERAQLKVICADGKNIKNTQAILDGKDFIGTSIG
ncbi:MAG: UMP kinase [Spirochaetales bacterium]